ncbi:uncharacterized protein LOC133711375 [Rosa rugosa]|uniref:uncharacterized protein LOC133711375 n=1 Tax=Rosa rugosa TaxID=74645 RepID=UPI002B416EA3|nr:uncharacterized protein LOC133711375 [Rosa rugosa]
MRGGLATICCPQKLLFFIKALLGTLVVFSALPSLKTELTSFVSVLQLKLFTLPHPLISSSMLQPNMDFKAWMLDMATTLQQDVVDKLLMSLWAIWKNRNNMFWHGTSQSHNEMMFAALSWLEGFRKARSSTQPSQDLKRKHKWQPDTEGKWKFNVDGSFIPHQTKVLYHIKPKGLGGVLRDSRGNFKAAFTLPVQHVESTKHVELLAINEGLKLMCSFPEQPVIVETECLDATLDLKNPKWDLLAYIAIMADIRALLQSKDSKPEIQICFAHRTYNRVAHRLASVAFDDNDSHVWRDNPLACIIDVLALDCI